VDFPLSLMIAAEIDEDNDDDDDDEVV